MQSELMASGTKNFAQDSEKVSCEHEELMKRISDLDSALDSLVCYAEVYADLSACARIVGTGRWLAGYLPEHFVYEETTVLASLARLGPESAAFVAEMKRQHKDITAQLKSFCQVVNGLPTIPDIEEWIRQSRNQGKRLTAYLAVHMGAEERKFASVKQ